MLKSKYINWLESCETVNYFNTRYRKLIDIINETNFHVGRYHDNEHLIKTGYLAFLTTTAITRNNPTGVTSPYYNCLTPEFDLLVKAALLHDYCYLGEHDDALNIKHTQNMVRVLAVEHSDVLSPEEAEHVNTLIAYTHYDHNHPSGEKPGEVGKEIYFDILRDCDQLYAALYFNKELFFKLYEEIGARFNYNIDDFVLRNKQYCQNLENVLKTDFALKVFKEIREELLAWHDDLYYTFPNCHTEQ